MNMEKTNLTILEHEDKTAKNGRDYTRFKTENGWMSCFELDVIKALKENEGKMCEVVIAKSDNGFTNIRGFVKVTEGSAKTDIEEENEAKPFKKVIDHKSMYISYAKDIFCAICTRISQATFDNMNEKERISLMDLSLKAIDKAIEHFN